MYADRNNKLIVFALWISCVVSCRAKPDAAILDALDSNNSLTVISSDLVGVFSSASNSRIEALMFTKVRPGMKLELLSELCFVDSNENVRVHKIPYILPENTALHIFETSDGSISKEDFALIMNPEKEHRICSVEVSSTKSETNYEGGSLLFEIGSWGSYGRELFESLPRQPPKTLRKVSVTRLPAFSARYHFIVSNEGRAVLFGTFDPMSSENKLEGR